MQHVIMFMKCHRCVSFLYSFTAFLLFSTPSGAELLMNVQLQCPVCYCFFSPFMHCDLFIPWQLSLSASQAASSAGRGFALFLPSSATERTTAGTTLTRPTAVRNLATHSARRTTWVHKAKDQSLREHSLN